MHTSEIMLAVNDIPNDNDKVNIYELIAIIVNIISHYHFNMKVLLES